jgi:hypothetical protein
VRVGTARRVVKEKTGGTLPVTSRTTIIYLTAGAFGGTVPMRSPAPDSVRLEPPYECHITDSE